MQSESGIRLKEMRADGGASDNTTLMQFQADVLERRVIKSEVAELSAMGSVYLGGLGVGFWLSLDELKNPGQVYSVYESKMQENIRDQHIAGWNRAVTSVLYTNKKTEA
jgi:glycerol kinase